MKNIEINKHLFDFSGLKHDFTIEFNVKGADYSGLTEKQMQCVWESGDFVNMYDMYANLCYIEMLIETEQIGYIIEDWSFAGRTNGWFVLLCSGDEDKIGSDLDILEEIYKKFMNNFNKAINKFYKNDE